MEESERDAAVEEFYTEYMRMKQIYGLAMNSSMKTSGECELEVYRMDGDQKRYISKLSDDMDDGTLLYKRALEDLRNFENKQKENGHARTA
jgi:hypothetical protein